MTEIREIQTEKIVPGDNDRQQFNQVALEELVASIEEHGLAQPITVRPVSVCSSCGRRYRGHGHAYCGHCYNPSLENKFEIVAGERRFRAVAQVLVCEL